MTKRKNTANCWQDAAEYNFAEIAARLRQWLNIDTRIVALKRFVNLDAVKALPEITFPNADKKFAFDQFVGQSRWQGTAIAVTAQHLVGAQCSTVIGLQAIDEAFLAGKNLAGVWFETEADAATHQQAMSCANPVDDQGNFYRALVVAPLASNIIDNPDVCLIYASPGQMILLINALQWSGYKVLNFNCVGESACADSWGNALQTGAPSLSIPCFAERKFGGVQDHELLLALAPSFLPKIVEGLQALRHNGIRYPIKEFGLENSPQDLLEKIYGPI